MIDLDGVDRPVGVGKCRGRLCDVRNAAWPRVLSARHGASVGLKDITRPRTAKGGVEDNTVVEKVRIYITIASKGCGRVAEATCVWIAATNAGRNAGPWKEPDVDARRCPFHGIDTASGAVESSTIGIGTGIRSGASGCGG